MFSVDILYPVVHSPEIDQFIDSHRYLEAPEHYVGDIFYEEWTKKKSVLGYLDTINLIEKYWDTEFRHKPKKFRSDACLIDWDTVDSMSNLFALTFGYFPSNHNLKDDFGKAFHEGLCAKTLKLPNNLPVPKEVNALVSPLSWTRHDLKPYGGYRREPGICIGGSDNFDDLIYFWNLRASGQDVMFLPTDQLSRYDAVVKDHLSFLDAIPSRNLDSNQMITIYYGSNVDEAKNANRKISY